ncbi:ArsR family transcriptional regulator [Paenibacillus antri]|uniref:ArsR family transcriptional regulator n=1 Tax=Paenibacillus antri TaxID=2582848 RepID=A0A5R9FXA5_9BACL|nr:ArsR family transcriptional regulator [Paenibacillus antri]TLS48652.1 ArsR family transcriptional regulator [Paenibacillus antri]
MTDDRTKRISPAQLQETAKALSGDLRLRILEALSDGPKSISQLMALLGAAQPTVSINVQQLEQAGLLESVPNANREKICARPYDHLHLELPRAPGDSLHEREQIVMPIGMYTLFQVNAPCGMAGKDGLIGAADDPRSFYLPERCDASLLWFSEDGFVEYRFPDTTPPEQQVKELTIAAELCSEARGFNEDWPSDITLTLNGVKTAVVTPKGDYGMERGKLTPPWWVYGTQFGERFEWKTTPRGTWVNGVKASDVTIGELGLGDGRPIVVKLSVEPEAEHRRGLNLFGSGFGNYGEGIKLTFVREKRPGIPHRA